MFAITFRLSPLYCLCLAGIFWSRLEAQIPNHFVSVEAGDLPIILAAHDGGSDQSVTTPPDGNALRIGVYVDEGAGPSVKNLLSVLSKFADVSVTQLKADDKACGDTVTDPNKSNDPICPRIHKMVATNLRTGWSMTDRSR